MSDEEMKVRKMVGPDGHPYELIERPNKLLAKAGGFRPDPERAARIQAKLSVLRDRYPDLAAEEVVKLRAAWRPFRETPSDAPTTERFATIAHDFKGQGGSFGYPLVTQVATSLCILLSYGDFAAPKTLMTIDLHVAAIEAIIAERLAGDGGNKGRELQDQLRVLLEACCPRQATPEIWRSV